MAEPTIEDAYEGFKEDLDYQVRATGEPQHEVFFRMWAERAAENGDTGDLAYCPVRKDVGRTTLQIDGVSIEADGEELQLCVCDLNLTPTLVTLNADGLRARLGRALNFLEHALDDNWLSRLEETSPAFSAAWQIHQYRNKLRRARVLLFTDARVSVRRDFEVEHHHGLEVTFSRLDFPRYVAIGNALGAGENITVSFEELGGAPLPCIRAHHDTADGCESYLSVMPGDVLAKLFAAYGPRLLEQNVRAYLQAKTKVNRGILQTIEQCPDRFFAYNNGLTATAAAVELVQGEGGLGLRSVTNLQIVNGGQTTASILHARDTRKLSLEGVFVQMKLSVVDQEHIPAVVPSIARYSNTQNKVSEADFFSNHPFHTTLEQISRAVSAPPRPGEAVGCKWFYERARGQYASGRSRGTAGERRAFELEFPRSNVIDKTDLAKYELAFASRPDTVSLGAQKAFAVFAELVISEWEKNQARFNKDYFQRSVAKAILFRALDKRIERSSWYQDARGYKANIVAYTVARISSVLKENCHSEIDFQKIWQKQEAPDALLDWMLDVARDVAIIVKNPPMTTRNVSEYAKQPACWNAVCATTITVPGSIEPCLQDIADSGATQRDAVRERRADIALNLEIAIAGLVPRAAEIRSLAKAKGWLSPKADAALTKLEAGNPVVGKPGLNALKTLLERLAEDGHHFLAT